jgi:hypothetical protein
MNRSGEKYLTLAGLLFSVCLIGLSITAQAHAFVWDFNAGSRAGWTVEFNTDPGADPAFWYDGANYSGNPAIGRPPIYGPLDAFDGSIGAIGGTGDDDSMSVFSITLLVPLAMNDISARFIISGMEYGIPASLSVYGQVGYKRVGSTSYFFGANFPLDRVVHTGGLYAYPLWTRASVPVAEGVMVTHIIVRIHVGATPWGFTQNWIDHVTDDDSCTLPVGHLDYCRDCGPCAEGQGDCDSNSECEGDLTCDQVTGTDYCVGCTLPVGHIDYCRDCGPCGPGEGDCDSDSECQSGLGCPQVPGTDVCLTRACPPVGHLDYCRDCGPCAEGEGDCDNDSECEAGLNCVQVTGTDYCRGCTVTVGHLDYCRDCGPCAAGEGDCDNDSECQSGLNCVQVTGTDVCCPHPLGHLDYCRDCGPCATGQGDCDNDSECQSGLSCPQVPGTDTCQ